MPPSGTSIQPSPCRLDSFGHPHAHSIPRVDMPREPLGERFTREVRLRLPGLFGSMEVPTEMDIRTVTASKLIAHAYLG